MWFSLLSAETWTLVLGLLTALMGSGWLAQWVKSSLRQRKTLNEAEIVDRQKLTDFLYQRMKELDGAERRAIDYEKRIWRLEADYNKLALQSIRQQERIAALEQMNAELGVKLDECRKGLQRTN